MIKLELSEAIFFYLSIFILGFLGTGIFSREKKGVSSSPDDYLWQCSICAHMYLVDILESLSICPRCGSYNQMKPQLSERK